MKKEFYYVEELKIFIRLSSIVSFQLVPHINTRNEREERCLIIIYTDTVHRCDVKHFFNLQNILK